MTCDITIIIPVKDEVDNIPILAGEVNDAMAGTPYAWECLWIDDGSTDGSTLALTGLSSQNPHHRFLSLDRNFGQSAAMAVGFQHAKGDILVTLDGDGQNDPKDIPALIQHLFQQKADMVNGWRKNREDTLIRKISSRIGNGFRNKLTRDNIQDVGCSIRAFRRQCVVNVPVFKGMHRFLPTLVRMGGCNAIMEIPVNHRPRKRGQTKYGIQNRLWVGLADTLAVCWMQKRLVFPRVKDHEGLKGNKK